MFVTLNIKKNKIEIGWTPYMTCLLPCQAGDSKFPTHVFPALFKLARALWSRDGDGVHKMWICWEIHVLALSKAGCLSWTHTPWRVHK